MQVFGKLWSDEAGFIVSSELVLIASIAVLGMIVGLTTLRDQVVAELVDVADAISTLNQSFSFSGLTGHSSSTSGTAFFDVLDFCDVQPPNANVFAECVTIVDAGASG